jgi:hypothetical protein
VIYCGTQNNVLLHHHHNSYSKSKQGGGAFGGMALNHATCLEDVPISYDQSLLKGIGAKHY